MGFVAMCLPGEAFTNLPTAARPGGSSVSTTPAKSVRFAYIQPMQTSPGWLRWVMRSNRISNAVYSRLQMVAIRGRKSCLSQRRSARWTSSYNPATPASSTPGCLIWNANRGVDQTRIDAHPVGQTQPQDKTRPRRTQLWRLLGRIVAATTQIGG